MIITDPDDLKKFKKSGEVLAKIMSILESEAKEGVSTKDLDNKAKKLCEEFAVKPAFYKYQNYPAYGCFGVNDSVVHGIPSEKEVLKDGDIISIDFGVIYEGFYSDMAVTVGIGNISKNASELIKNTKLALDNAIKEAFSGNHIGDIGYAIESTAENNGLSVVREMVGHGIGKVLHDDPYVPGYGNKGQGELLIPGMALAIEAIINEGSEKIVFLSDGWTTKTLDHKLSAIFEKTVIVGEKEAVIVT